MLSQEVPGLDERSHGVQEHVLVIRQHHDYVGEGGGAPGQGEDAQQGEEGDHGGDGTYTQEYRYTLVSILYYNLLIMTQYMGQYTTVQHAHD